MYGINKNISDLLIKCNVTNVLGTDIIKITLNDTVITILPMYIRGVEWDSDFKAVENLFMEESPVNPIIIGDLNVRIGDHQQHLEERFLSTFHAHTGPRKSKDKIKNAKGKTLMDFCEDYGLMVLNGRTRGDENGNFTFVSGVGESVNDICAVSVELLELVNKFCVDEQTWSDHMPIHVSLQIQANITKENSKLLPKLRWEERYREPYRRNVISGLRRIKEEKDTLTLEDITEVICKSKYHNSTADRQIFKANNKWFNWSCYNARKLVRNMLKEYNQNCNQTTRLSYLKANADYNKLLATRKEKYYADLEKRLNMVTDSKSWWKLANEIRNKSTPMISNISASDFKEYFMILLNPPTICQDIQYAPLFQTDAFLDRAITESEIYQVLSKAKPHKAPGEDRITYEFYKNAPNELITEIANAYNYMFENTILDKSFTNSVIFPIFKKGDINDPGNYRGISFMNCIAKIFMGVIAQRMESWVCEKNILMEYQAGFRKNYSTADNIYSLTSIVQLKLNERKKVYAFFVDFRAAFDKIARKSLMFKLHGIGVSTKMVQFIEKVYQQTTCTVWNGEEISDKFETYTGVKQGCILSPLLFSLYINDLHEQLSGGLHIGDLNIRLLLYADDIVLIAEKIEVLQAMINKLEEYCDYWNLEVNLTKSKIMVFRNGGKLANNEKWLYRGTEIEIVNEYSYLGTILTPKAVFTKHVEARSASAKNCINSTWNNLLSKNDVSLKTKIHLFNAVCRSVQSYGAEIWGHSYFEQVDKLQRYFLKRVLKLPKFTPNYALMLESGLEDSHLHTLNMHLRYIYRTLFEYEEARLPHKISVLILIKNISWANRLNTLGSEFNIQWLPNMAVDEWSESQTLMIESMKVKKYENMIESWSRTESFYKNVDPLASWLYFNGGNTSQNVMWMFKTRCDLIGLNGSHFSRRNARNCTLCNMKEAENLLHFIGRCPVLNFFRVKYFDKMTISEDELITILNGKIIWQCVVNYVKDALAYRKLLVNEFNA